MRYTSSNYILSPLANARVNLSLFVFTGSASRLAVLNCVCGLTRKRLPSFKKVAHVTSAKHENIHDKAVETEKIQHK